MGWFSKEAAERPAPEKRDAQDNEAKREATCAEIERLRGIAEAAALAKMGPLFEKAKEVHAADVAAYSFSCRRWGDYLTVFLERKCEGWMSKAGSDTRAYSTAINIRDTRTITLTEGHAPDMEGSLGYSLRQESENSKWSVDDWSLPELREGYQWAVAPLLPQVYFPGEMFALDAKGNDILSHRDSETSRFVRRTRNTLRCAVADSIHFSGVGATVYAPAGRGQEVYDAIMREIASVFP